MYENRIWIDLKELANKIDDIHTSVVLALQKHLRKTKSKVPNIFAKGKRPQFFQNFVTLSSAIHVLVKLRDISDGLMPQQLSHFELLGLTMQPLFCEIYN